MTTETHSRRRFFPRNPHREVSSEHRLEFLDQTAFELMRATGRGQLMQCVWVYEHPVDYEALRRFHRNFAESHGGRHIERSPLPFGRPRWVKPTSAPSEIQFNEKPRPRTELMDWADELAALPIDPEHGPTWYLVVQPLTDGSTAISMVGSHVIGDGLGAGLAIFEAVTGNVRDAGYDRPGIRLRRRALAADLRQAVRDLPETHRALVKGAKLVYAKRHELAESRRSRTAAGSGRPGRRNRRRAVHRSLRRRTGMGCTGGKPWRKQLFVVRRVHREDGGAPRAPQAIRRRSHVGDRDQPAGEPG